MARDFGVFFIDDPPAKKYGHNNVSSLKLNNLHNVPLENRAKFQKQMYEQQMISSSIHQFTGANRGLYLPGHATLARRFGTGLAGCVAEAANGVEVDFHGSGNPVISCLVRGWRGKKTKNRV